MPSEKFTVNAPSELIAQVQAAADAAGLTRAEWTRQALEAALHPSASGFASACIHPAGAAGEAVTAQNRTPFAEIAQVQADLAAMTARAVAAEAVAGARAEEIERLRADRDAERERATSATNEAAALAARTALALPPRPAGPAPEPEPRRWWPPDWWPFSRRTGP